MHKKVNYIQKMLLNMVFVIGRKNHRAFDYEAAVMKVAICLIMFAAFLINACCNARNNNSSEKNGDMVKEIILYSPGKDKEIKLLYKLFIPSKYVISDAYKYARVLLKAAYPGMVASSLEIKHRFIHENGTWSPDLVYIGLYFNGCHS